MKTKLTIEEAEKAFFEGKKLRNINWINKNDYIEKHPKYYMAINEKRSEEQIYFEDGKWELYEEPPTERLATTLEEALRASEIRVFWPDYTNGRDSMESSLYAKDEYDGWDFTAIAAIHAALSLPGAKVVIESEGECAP